MGPVKFANLTSATSAAEDFKDFQLNFSTADIEKEWFYGERQISIQQSPLPETAPIILRVIDGEIFGVFDKKLPPSE